MKKRFVAGFILNKLYTLRCFARKGSHGKHTELLNVPKGFPKNLLKGEGDVISRCRKMNGQLVWIFKSTREDHICALIGGDATTIGLRLCNYYREKVGLRPFDSFFREIVDDAPSGKEDKRYHKLSEKEKRNAAYREKVAKWMEDSR